MNLTARQAAKIRKRAAADAKRERAAIAKAEFERLAAIRAEQIAEEQAPQAQRLAIVTQDGVTVRPPLAEPDVKRGGYRRADPLHRMHVHSPQMVTRAHLAAAKRFSTDYEIAHGALCGGHREAVDGGGSCGEEDIQFAAMERYRGACEALGASLRSVVELSVLHKRPLAHLMLQFGMSQERAAGWLIGGLDRLADHYWPEQPAREPRVIDERAGRWRKQA
jgi:hypothetical protein